MHPTKRKTQINKIIGIDEVGRGPVAGIVVASAVRLHCPIPELNDSKKLSEKKREELNEIIIANSDYAIAHASIAEIEEINILNAALLAMRRAFEKLNLHDYEEIIIDGNKNPIPDNPKSKTLVKADSLIPSVSAASIVAKVYRDNLMKELHAEHPQYDWASNKGYGTKKHLEAIKQYGITPFHRPSFLKKLA